MPVGMVLGAGAAEEKKEKSTKETRSLKANKSHPDAPAKKKSLTASDMQTAGPVASPARTKSGALAEGGTARDTSSAKRSRSPRAEAEPRSTEKQKQRKPKQAKQNQTAIKSAIPGQEKPQRGRSAGSAKQPTSAPQENVSSRQTCREERVGSQATPSKPENVAPEAVVQIPHAVQCARILARQLKVKKKMIAELASKEDYEGAAVAQKELSGSELRARRTRARPAQMPSRAGARWSRPRRGARSRRRCGTSRTCACP